MTDINVAFATRIPMVGARTIPGMTESGTVEDTMVLPPMHESGGMYQATYPGSVPTTVDTSFSSPAQVPYVAAQPKYVIEGSPEHKALSAGGAVQAPSLSPAQAQQLQMHAAAANQGYLERMGQQRRDVVKLLILAMMITLGISLHWVLSFYCESWIGGGDFTDRQEFFARAVYPLGVLFVIWNIKAFQRS